MTTYSFPNKILKKIFSCLSPKDIAACRAVCCRWQKIIDYYTPTEALWRIHCQIEYHDICNTAYRKLKPSLNWHHLYKSLALWPKISQVQETGQGFDLTEHVGNEIFDFQVLRDGIVGVLMKEAIVYYDINTFKPIRRRNINREYEYVKYRENDYFVLLSTSRYCILVTIKDDTNPSSEITTMLEDVDVFIIINNVVYYTSINNELISWKKVDGSFVVTKEADLHLDVISLGCQNDYLYVLTYDLNILMLYQNELRILLVVEESHLFFYLRVYNFLEQIQWEEFCDWLDGVYEDDPRMYWTDIVSLRAYGRVILVGYSWGLISIFYSAYSDTLSDVFKSKPLKKFLLPWNCHVSIIDIDVVEGENSHTILVGTQRNMVVVNINHSLLNTSPKRKRRHSQ